MQAALDYFISFSLDNLTMLSAMSFFASKDESKTLALISVLNLKIVHKENF